jgi:acyl-CoA synthetase (AMP-forming)/AMP-acid ligase II/pyrroloquinoline quinone (PQQ) biosynthesis protein C
MDTTIGMRAPVDDFLRRLRGRPAEALALQGASIALTYADLLCESERVAAHLRAERVQVLATQIDNGPAWIVIDVAALMAGIVHVPLPRFFAESQTGHALHAAGADALLTEADNGAGAMPIDVAGTTLRLRRHRASAPSLHAGTAKITFTSGSTGRPKGVCLSAASMLAVAAGVAEALSPLGIERHLTALPLPVLLENIAGVYAPLLVGASIVVLPGEQVGLRGSSAFDASALQRQVEQWSAQSVIALPQMLRLWTAWRARHGAAAPDPTLRFVAVGGAAVGAPAVLQARAAGLPAYEGYGVSEGASVQTLNRPGFDRPGSAGRALPHARVRVDATGEVEIAGSAMLGYLGGPPVTDSWWPTGDLGRLDPEGYLHLEGRRSNVLITGFGRNISPEWVETALQSQPEIAHAVVFGDGDPALWAVLWPSPLAAATDSALAQAVARANVALPDYARVVRWVRADEPFCAAAGLATENGRPLRPSVLALGRRLLASSIPATEQATMNPPKLSFYQLLRRDTEAERQQLISAPIIAGTLRGEVSLSSYLAFLTEAYHHVRHTVPLLQACRERLPARLHWLRAALDEYIDEEAGHDEWILGDIGVAGGNAAAVRHGSPGTATEVMVAYAYDTIARGNPLGFLGMVHVLEGTSADLALAAADRIQKGLGLPDSAFIYLRSHGTLDREHTAHFERLVNALDDDADRDAVVHAARVFYRLYGDVYRSLPLPQRERVAA